MTTSNDNQICECGHRKEDHMKDGLFKSRCEIPNCSCLNFTPNEDNHKSLLTKEEVSEIAKKTMEEYYKIYPEEKDNGSPSGDEKIIEEFTDEELRNYVRTEFVDSGFISVFQWRNFIDYLQILLKQEKQKALTLQRKEFEKMIDELSKSCESGFIPIKGKAFDNKDFIIWSDGKKLTIPEIMFNLLEELKQKLQGGKSTLQNHTPKKQEEI